MADDDEIILSELSDDELVLQMHDDLYDGLKEEIEEGVNILIARGWARSISSARGCTGKPTGRCSSTRCRTTSPTSA